MVLAQATEVAQVAKGWGEQLPALALGLLAMLVLVLLFLRAMKAMTTDFRTTLQEQHAAALKVAERADTTQRETNQLLGKVEKALGQVCEESKSTRGVMHDTQGALRDTRTTLTHTTTALQAVANRG